MIPMDTRGFEKAAAFEWADSHGIWSWLFPLEGPSRHEVFATTGNYL